MARIVGKPLVRDQIIDCLASGPRRYSEIVKLLNRPDKTIYQGLERLGSGPKGEGLVRKNAEGRYELTEKGKEESGPIEEKRLPKADDILKAALQTKSEMEIKTLLMAYMILRMAEKAARGHHVVKMKTLQSEAAKQLRTVRGELDRQSPGWVHEYFKSIGRVDSTGELFVDAIDKLPDGLPYSIPVAATAHSLETPLRLLEEELPKGAGRALLKKARKLTSEVYEELMRVFIEESLTK